MKSPKIPKSKKKKEKVKRIKRKFTKSTKSIDNNYILDKFSSCSPSIKRITLSACKSSTTLSDHKEIIKKRRFSTNN